MICYSKDVQIPQCHPERTHYAKGQCKSCYDYAYYRANAEAQRAYGRNRYRNMGPEARARDNMMTRWRRYGMSPEQGQAMIDSQGGKCAACGDVTSDWHVDHDHGCCPTKAAKTCGKCVRSLLCAPCNLGIGFFRDSPDRLDAAAAYLRRF